MSRMGRINAAALVLLIFASSATASADQLDLGGMQGMSTVQRHSIEVPELAQTYILLVREPEGYREDPQRRYPLVVLLDGGATFGALAGYTRYLNLGEELPPMLVVGISYGTDDWQQGNARSRDYTAPSAEREFWGGAGAFLSCLRERLVPFLEANYRVDPAHRILFGQSLGGQFVLFAAQQDPGLFQGLIASNPALHRNLPLFLEPAVARKVEARPRLFVANGSEDDPEYRDPLRLWIRHWRAHPQPPWILETRVLPGFAHFSALTESFRQGLRWYFGGE